MKTNPFKSFDKRLFANLLLCFLIIPVIIIVSHEGGHYAVARMQGHSNARLHYNHTDTGRNAIIEEYRAVKRRNKLAIAIHQPFAEQEQYNKLHEQYEGLWEAYKDWKFTSREALLYAAGPMVNMMTAIIGIALLLYYRSRFRQMQKLNPGQWLIIFAAISCYQYVFTLIGVAFHPWFDPDFRTDAYKVSVHFGLYPWTFNILEGIFGVWAFWFAYKYVPRGQRFTLLAASVTGIGAGTALWWYYLGPLLLP